MWASLWKHLQIKEVVSRKLSKGASFVVHQQKAAAYDNGKNGNGRVT